MIREKRKHSHKHKQNKFDCTRIFVFISINNKSSYGNLQAKHDDTLFYPIATRNSKLLETDSNLQNFLRASFFSRRKPKPKLQQSWTSSTPLNENPRIFLQIHPPLKLWILPNPTFYEQKKNQENLFVRGTRAMGW